MNQRRYFSTAEGQAIPPSSHAKILIADIETAPVMAAVWGLWNNNVGLSMIDKDWFILAFSAKWLGASKVLHFNQAKHQAAGGAVEDDTELLGKLWTLLDQADIVVAHNGRKFDIKKINARFIQAGFLPPSPYKIVDTLEIAKRHFAFTSNKLEYIADKINTTYKKLKHTKFPGFELWKQVLLGNRLAWKEMRVYNDYDVLSLEEAYLQLRVWDSQHPNVGVYSPSDDPVCPICGGNHLDKRGFQYTGVGKYQRYVCTDCGAWSKGGSLVNTIEKRKGLIRK
jgi:RNase_H superfamily